MYCRSSHLTNELNLQIKNPSTNICLDAQGKIETDESPVGVYECHGQGGNQVSISTSKLPSQLNSPSNSMSPPPASSGSRFFVFQIRSASLYMLYSYMVYLLGSSSKKSNFSHWFRLLFSDLSSALSLAPSFAYQYRPSS